MMYFITDSKIMFNICCCPWGPLPIKTKKKEKCGQSSQKALRVPSPLQWGRFLRGGKFGTNTKLLRAVTGPISTRNDYLNTVFDDVVSLRGSCRNKRPSHDPHGKRFNSVAVLFLRVKNLSLQEVKEYAICRSPRDRNIFISRGLLEGL